MLNHNYDWIRNEGSCFNGNEYETIKPLEFNVIKHGGATMENKSIIDSAKAYEPKQTYNISELQEVDVNLVLEDRSGKDKDGKEFNYQVIIIEGKEYRCPPSVLEKLQEALKIRSDIKKFKVTSVGSGLNTRYSIEIIE